jgi:hypothetical protein
LRWIVSFFLFLAIGASWAFASPIFSGPDEPSHIVHAAAIPRGDLIGREVKDQAAVEVTAPRVYKDRGVCFAFKPTQPASCFDFSPKPGDATLGTYTARYFPLYAAVVGFGSYWYPPGSGQVYLMRLISAAVIAALLASCVSTVAGLGSTGYAIGFLFALTPMVLYFSGIVNPSSWEMAAGVGVWTHGIALTGAGAGDDPRVLRRFGIAAILLCLTRPLSPLWVFLAVIVLLVVAGRPRIEELYRRRAVQGWAAAVIGAAFLQLAWTLYAKPLGEGNTTQPGLDWGVSLILRGSVGKTYWSTIYEMIGRFGWNDTLVPYGTTVIWLIAVGALMLFAVSFGSKRFVWAMVVTLLFTFVVPVAIETARAGNNGLVWHGRYTLPFAVGIPLLGGYALRDVGSKFDLRRIAWWLGVGFVIAQGFAYAQALRRYTVGSTNKIWYFLDPSWNPPLPAWLLTFGFLAVIAALALWVFKAAVDGERAPYAPPPPDAHVDPTMVAVT